MTDSAGVRIVEHSEAPSESSEIALVLDGAKELSGTTETGPLFRVRGALRLPGGGTAVADAGNFRVVIFGSEGDLVRTQGREGEGPGEYRDVALLARWKSDSLAVWDRRARRLSILDGTGAYERSIRFEAADSTPYGSVSGVYPDGSTLAIGFVALEGEITTGRHEFSAPLYHFSEDGVLQSDVGLYPIGETYYVASDGGFNVYPALFARSVVRIVVADRLVLASSGRYEIRFHTPSGRLVQLLRRRSPPRRVNDALRAAAVEAVLEPMSADAARRTRAVFEDMSLPDHLPAFGEVFGDHLGRLWVQEYEVGEPAVRGWRVYEAEGALMGKVAVPNRLRLMDAGTDYVIAVSTDELDVEHVLVIPLAR